MQHMVEGESSTAAHPALDTEMLVSAIASSSEIQRVTKKDAQALVRRIGAGWSVETALRDCKCFKAWASPILAGPSLTVPAVERFSSAKVDAPHDTHFDIANVLMTIDNSSYHSFARASQSPPQQKHVDISDLRQALGGAGTAAPLTAAGANGLGPRVDTMDTSGTASVISTTGTGGFIGDANGSPVKSMSAAARKEDVREVLKDIFKDKKRGAAAKKAAAVA